MVTRGARIHYLTAGSGTPVLLLQGVGAIAEAWRPQLDGLADGFRLIAPDNRGIGQSSILNGVLTIEAMARDALTVLDDQGVTRCHVAGHSMGGVIAQALALAAPQRVASLALMCTVPRGRDASRFSWSILVTAIRMRVGAKRRRRDAFLELVFPASYLASVDRAALADRMAALFGHDLANQPTFAMRQLRALSRYDASPLLATLASIPTLVVSAAHDRITPPVFGKALAQAIPGSRYVEMTEAGHAAPIQQAVETNDLLREFWSANQP